MSKSLVKNTNDISALLRTLGSQAREAYRILAASSHEARNRALIEAAHALRISQEVILAANAQDMSAAEKKGIAPALLDRLKLTGERVESMAKGLEEVTALPDPLAGEDNHGTLTAWSRPNGLKIRRVAVPLGVVGIIYESRPNVTADAAALCLKAGNAAILRGGSESFHSSAAILAAMQAGLKAAGLPQHAVQAVPTTDREAVGEMLRLTEFIDVIIPRGGESLTRRVQEESRIPTLLHLIGNCHTYIHSAANPDMAEKVLINAKLRRTGICGATESLLIDRAVAPKLLPRLAATLLAQGCELRGDAESRKIEPRISPATEEDWSREYLDKILSVKTVADASEAIAHINRYGSHHTDAIITEENAAAAQFLKEVDSAIVMHNTSTQFADGGEFGMGAEIGIATGRLHARGPVGAAQLVTYKYVVEGSGQIRPV